MPVRRHPTVERAESILKPKSENTSKSPANLPSGIKRKEREGEYESNDNTDIHPKRKELGEDTSIHVVVRCRGRNDREIKENSGVSVVTEGVKGKTVELSMGPNAVSNKAYNFDKVFSPAADQNLVYEDVVVPLLNEVSFPLHNATAFYC